MSDFIEECLVVHNMNINLPEGQMLIFTLLEYNENILLNNFQFNSSCLAIGLKSLSLNLNIQKKTSEAKIFFNIIKSSIWSFELPHWWWCKYIQMLLSPLSVYLALLG